MTPTDLQRLTFDAVNAFDRQTFVDLLGDVFEHSHWVARGAWASLPFCSLDDLHAAMMAEVFAASRQKQIEFLCMHPELAGQEAQEGKLTDSSASEQSRLGFHMLSEAELSHMTALNRRYLDRFGFPCIIALQRHKTRKSVIAELEHRLGNDRDDEIDAGLQQIGIITRGRLQALGLPADVAQGCAPAGLTTHVLDAVHGAGAAGVRIELGRFEGVTLRPLKIVHTRANGRAELLEASEMDAGEYQLAFAVADYFRRRGTALADPPFLDEVVIRFVVAEPIRHCHVPVIASPWTYSTYRGGLPPKGE